MIDLHCHILPGVDDGAPDLATALDMARLLVKHGFTRVTASPHFAGPGGDVAPEHATRVRGELTAALAAEKIPLELLPSSEHHVSPELFERLDKRGVVPIGGAGKWLLVELSWSPMPDPEGLLFRIQAKGWRLLLAHPERYTWLDPDVVARLVARGVKTQLELGSFTGLYGQRATFKALALADRGLGHVVATDLHRAKDADAWLPAALRAVADRYGKRAVEAAATTNPQLLIDDAPSDGVQAFTVPR